LCDSTIPSISATHPAAAHLILWGKVQSDNQQCDSATRQARPAPRHRLYTHARARVGGGRDRVATRGVPPPMGAASLSSTPLSDYMRLFGLYLHKGTYLMSAIG